MKWSKIAIITLSILFLLSFVALADSEDAEQPIQKSDPQCPECKCTCNPCETEKTQEITQEELDTKQIEMFEENSKVFECLFRTKALHESITDFANFLDTKATFPTLGFVYSDTDDCNALVSIRIQNGKLCNELSSNSERINANNKITNKITFEHSKFSEIIALLILDYKENKSVSRITQGYTIGYRTLTEKKQLLLSYLQDEILLRSIAAPIETLLPYFELIVDKNTMLSELLKFWQAAGKDMVTTEKSANENANFAYTNYQEGWILRRWLSKGGAKSEESTNLVLAYKFWLATMIAALDPSIGSGFLKSVKADIEKSNSILKDYYLQKVSSRG